MKYHDMITMVFEAEGLDPSDLSRKGNLPITRYMCFKIGKTNHPYLSLEQIGRPFGLDHATVLHGIKTLDDLMFSDRSIRAKYNRYYSMSIELSERSFGILLQS